MTREALLKRNAADLALLARSWLPVRRRLEQDLARLLEAIGDRQPTRDQLRRMDRYKELLGQVETLVNGYAAGVEPRIRAAQQMALTMGLSDATAAIGAGAVRVPLEAVNALVGQTSVGPLRDLLAEFGPQAAARAGEVLTEGLALGLNPRRIAAEFRKATGTSAVRALRIARTETLRAYRTASLDTYRANSDVVSGWRWLSAKQTRTCPFCREKDGQTFGLETPFTSHVNCRCTSVPILKEVA